MCAAVACCCAVCASVGCLGHAGPVRKKKGVCVCVCVGAYSGMFRVLVAWGQLCSAIGVYRDLISVKRGLIFSVKRDLVSFAACPVAIGAYSHTRSHKCVCVCVCVCVFESYQSA